MGRRAKYFTREERLVARRAQRALRDSKPEAKQRRQIQNRRAWRRKRERELLLVAPPEIPEAVHQQAAMNMSDAKHVHIFEEFCGGREDMQLEEIDLDWGDFNMLIGIPPYPHEVISRLDLSEEWPLLRSALHGVMAYRYLQYCEDLIRRCKRPSGTPGHIRAGLDSTFQELVCEYNKVASAARQLFEQGNKVGVAVANHNTKWISRIMVYTLEDMATVRNGCDGLIRTLTERKWEVELGE
ncbi:hypothetical protein NMY22_g14024 [Coprinellus aureogranulatus]|nr:hypothetical protein NMY22_g14024 [Coprinellus aureogranulatus]